MRLRDYQKASSDAILAKWEQFKSTLLVLYTGGGKTIIFADIIRRIQPKRALVLAHREELIFQAREKIEGSTGLPCQIEMADSYAHTDLFNRTPVIVATVQSLVSGRTVRRMERFDPNDFGAIICDEAHHYVSPSFKSVVAYFQRNPSLKVLGVTATPKRADDEALHQVFESVAARYTLIDGIEGGWLCDITQQFVPVSGLDYSHIKTTAGDLNSAQLNAVMEQEKNVMGICQPTLEVIFGLAPHTLDSIPVPDWGNYLSSLHRLARRTIAFTASVAQATACCNIFNRAIDGLADWVCGETSKENRRETLAKFKNGRTRLIANCGVLTEGFDDPGVEVIIMGRPTKSESLYLQMIGRSTRTVPGLVDNPDLDTAEKRKQAISFSEKPFCRIVDFVGNTGRHTLITCMDVLGGKTTPAAIQFAIKKAKEEGKPVRVTKSLTNAEIEVLKERKIQEEARKKALIARSKFSVHEVNGFRLNGDAPALHKSRKVGNRPFSEKQFRFLQSRGYDPTRMNYGYGTKIIAQEYAKMKK